MNKTILFSLIIILFLTSGLILMKNSTHKNHHRKITFATPQIPFSSDPLDYDYYAHHYAFSSIFAKLVSTEKNGELTPMIASSWSNSNNFKVWKFKIRTDLKYSNNDIIKIDDVILNLKRIAYLKKINNSRSGLMEFLLGFDDIQNLSDNFDGIKKLNDEIILEFIKPMPTLLEIISFGFYGIAHPSLFNTETGQWKDKKNIISSGPYQVVLWNDNEYEISYRNNVQYFKNDNPLKEIRFSLLSNLKKASDLNDVDIVVADKSSLLIDERFTYSGSSINMKIGYVYCNSWNKKEKIFSDINVRRWFRAKFYKSLEKNNFEITNSFLPLNLQHIQRFSNTYSVEKPNFEHFDLVTHPISISGKIEENNNKKSIAEIFSDGLKALGEDSGATLIQKDLPSDDMYDLTINGTGVESINYIETIRFMFLSKEGIRLPDSTGVITTELNKNNPDINIINQELWNQAIIWPIRHYSSGYWFNETSKIDYSLINFDSASIDFQFLKWK